MPSYLVQFKIRTLHICVKWWHWYCQWWWWWCCCCWALFKYRIIRSISRVGWANVLYHTIPWYDTVWIGHNIHSYVVSRHTPTVHAAFLVLYFPFIYYIHVIFYCTHLCMCGIYTCIAKNKHHQTASSSWKYAHIWINIRHIFCFYQGSLSI